MTTEDLAVTHNEAARRFEVILGDAVAFLRYGRDGSHMTMQHTEVPKEFEGKGIASRIAQTAMDFARDNGLKVIPHCPYVAGWITRHPEYESITVR